MTTPKMRAAKRMKSITRDQLMYDPRVVMTYPRITQEQYHSVLEEISYGTPFTRALKKLRIHPGSFWQAANDPNMRPLYGAAKERAALAMMEDVRDRAMTCADALPNNPGAIAVLAKATQPVARAYDNALWGDKVQVEGRHLVLHTNLSVGEGEILDLARIEADEIQRRNSGKEIV